MSTLTKSELIEVVSHELSCNKTKAKEFVDIFFQEIKEGLTSGHEIRLSGFGNFLLRDKRERPGRNPKTGEVVPVSARRVTTFKPGNKLQATIEDCHKKMVADDPNNEGIATDD